MSKVLDPCQQIERSIITKYRKTLWNPFIAAVKRCRLIAEGDRIAVCISGGKDSMLMAKLMQELSRHSDVPFEAVYLVMDPGYNEINRQKIESNAALLQVPITVFESDIFAVANNTDRNPCYLCARMRRGALYSKARELGCNNRSSTCSMPTDRRIRPSVIPTCRRISYGMEACVMVAGWQTRLSTPPRLSARAMSRKDLKKVLIL